MASNSPLPLSPHYGVDLRALMNLSLGEPEPMPAEPVPSGTIGERIKAPPPAIAPPLVACPEIMTQETQPSEVRIITADQYWPLALPHRLFVLGPLLDLAQPMIRPAVRLHTEQQLLDLYRRSYHCVPLPPHVLAAIKEQVTRAPRERLAAWLDAGREEVMAAATLDNALAERKALRLDALRRGASGCWGDRTVAVAELMTDVFTLCRASKEDVERAARISDQFGGSISLAIQSLDVATDTTFEKVLASMIRPALSNGDLPEGERAAILAFAARRSPYWLEGLFLPRPAHPSVSIHLINDRGGRRSRVVEVGPSAEPGETAAECYRRIRDQLEDRIIGRPELCRRLALVGTAHLHGIANQRVLLCGPTGSGKTHSARALAEAIERPFLHVDMGDTTATGWKGLSIPDVLDLLVQSVGGRLDGAVLHLDEVDKVRINSDTTGNSHDHAINRQASLLALLDGRPVTPETGTDQLETSRLLVIGTGAFDGQFTKEPPSTQDLTRWGWMSEFAARWGERLVLSPPGLSEAIELLRSSERSVGRHLGPMLEALKIKVEVPDTVLAYTADLWLRTGSDFRSAADWLLAAAKQRLIELLEQGRTDTIVLVPDDIVIQRASGNDRRPFR